MHYRKAIQFIDKGHAQTLVFLPGWALDTRIFDTIESPFNRLYLNDICSASLISDLKQAFHINAIKPAHFIGFSMGAFRCLDIFKQSPGLIRSVTLIGLNTGYKKTDIALIRRLLIENIQGYLRSFYQACFHEKSEFRSFYTRLGKEFCNTLELKTLLSELDYLDAASVRLEDLVQMPNLTLIHGKYDRIAPLKNMSLIYKACTSVQLPPTGHIEAITRIPDAIP